MYKYTKANTHSTRILLLHAHQPTYIKMQKLAVLLALLAATAIACSDAGAAVRMQLTRTDAGRGFTRRELLRRMALRSKARAARLLSRAANGGGTVSPAQLDDDDGAPDAEYLVRFAVGTPPQPVQLELDTGSDLTWTQCEPCAACFDQALPYFNTALSSTLAVPPCFSSECQALPLSSCGTQNGWGDFTCVYTYSYADNCVTTGILHRDTFTFAGAAAERSVVPGLAFGCGVFNSGSFDLNETGIAGFGRGPLSLPSQLKVANFSYCLAAINGSAASHFLLGLPANLYGSGRGTVQTTPLIQNPQAPSFYYLSLKGITVGSTKLPIPESTFALTNDGMGGTFIDSGTSMTMLPKDVYKLVHDAFVAQVKLPVQNLTAMSGHLCFSVPPMAKPTIPKLVFHFEGATLDLPQENYMFEMEEAGSSFTCLALDATDAGEDALTIIGNYQQQNMHVLYDLANNKLSFVSAQCDKV
ncbi:hypothetical protein ACP4OV_005120 [Aristida adscensionis]